MTADSTNKKPLKKRAPKEKPSDTVAGFSRFLYAMNLMLEKASAASQYDLTRHETLLLSIFRNGIVSRKRVEEEFCKLLAMQSENPLATQASEEAFGGLVRKGLIKPVKRSVKITAAGRSEVKRISDIIDAVYDQLIETVGGKGSVELQVLMRRIGSARSTMGRKVSREQRTRRQNA